MKVILLEDIDKIGKKLEIKEIKDGYARNLLIPKGLVRLADEQAMKWLEGQKEVARKKAEESLRGIQETASDIDGLEVIISVKVGEEGQLFEKISSQKIADKLKELGYRIDKDQIELAEPIDALGEFPVRVKLDHNLEPEIQVVITEEK